MATPQCLNCQQAPAAILVTTFPDGDTQQLCSGCMVGWIAWMVKTVFDVDLLPPEDTAGAPTEAQEGPEDTVTPITAPKDTKRASKAVAAAGPSQNGLSVPPTDTGAGSDPTSDGATNQPTA